MTTETFIGFDSAWANKVPGAICKATFHHGRLLDFQPPQLARFDDAAQIIEQAVAGSDFVLVALDQPTLVPNSHGMRPVERVAASVVNAIKGGVQPAYRAKTSLFGENAPIWRFLDRINARENPSAARTNSRGLFLIETFPALALPTIIPEIWHRKRAAKYNPSVKRFSIDDWQLVSRGVAQFTGRFHAPSLARSAIEFAHIHEPRKADQDKLDALICLSIALNWRRCPKKESMVIGDGITGYMVTPTNQITGAILAAAALKLGVPADGLWNGDANRATVLTASKGSTPHPTESCTPVVDDMHRSGMKRCPECGYAFKGTGWGGMDAHWRARHADIMPYGLAWPIIERGGKPSAQSSGQ